MSNQTVTITLSKHYISSRFSTDEEVKEAEKNYNVVFAAAKRGKMTVTGEIRKIESFVDDLTLGDEEASGDILDTMV